MASPPRRDGKFAMTTFAEARVATQRLEILAKESAVFKQRAQKPGGSDKGDEGENSLSATKQLCEFETLFLFAYSLFDGLTT